MTKNIPKATTNYPLRITQIRSPIGYPKRQRATLIGLGLNKRHRTLSHPDTPEIRGMIAKIKHLLLVEHVTPPETVIKLDDNLQ